jgi:hypothetical protein
MMPNTCKIIHILRNFLVVFSKKQPAYYDQKYFNDRKQDAGFYMYR